MCELISVIFLRFGLISSGRIGGPECPYLQAEVLAQGCAGHTPGTRRWSWDPQWSYRRSFRHAGSMRSWWSCTSGHGARCHTHVCLSSRALADGSCRSSLRIHPETPILRDESMAAWLAIPCGPLLCLGDSARWPGASFFKS